MKSTTDNPARGPQTGKAAGLRQLNRPLALAQNYETE